MLELNVITAIPLGAFAALVWTLILLKRLLRAPRCYGLSSKQRFIVYLTGAIALIPALTFGFFFAGFLSLVTVVPGVWNHLALALTMVFSLAFVGTVIPAAAGWVLAKLLLRHNNRGV